MLELFGREMLILGCGESHIAVHDATVVVAPRADDNNVTVAVQADLAEWFAAGRINLDVPSGDSVVEMIEVRIGCGNDSPERANGESRKQAGVRFGVGVRRSGNYDVSVHGRRAESPNDPKLSDRSPEARS